MKEFTVSIPDACYEREPETWDRFIAAIQKQLNQMSVGALKYHYDKCSTLHDDTSHEDNLKFVYQRIALYDKIGAPNLCDCEGGKKHAINCFLTMTKLGTGNVENLLDAANGLVIEFLFPKHKKAHFRSQSSDESPGIPLVED